MKPAWDGPIMSVRTGASLVARILVMILKKNLHKLIGLKSEQVLGDWTFGIRTMLVLVHLVGRVPPEKKYSTAFVRSSLIIYQNLL